MIYEFAAAVLFLDDRGAGTLHKGAEKLLISQPSLSYAMSELGRVPFCQAGTRRCADKIWPCL